MAVPAAFALALLAGSAASVLACTNLATLQLSSHAARVGERVVVVGSSFPVSRSPERATTPVVLHWETADGPVLGEAVPDPTGTISLTIQVPDVPAGHSAIVAVQRRPLATSAGEGAVAGGDPSYVDEVGTPARASIRVLAPGEPRPEATRPSAPPAMERAASSPTMLILTAALGAVALSVFGGGFIAYLHHHRTLALERVPTPPNPPSWPGPPP